MRNWAGLPRHATLRGRWDLTVLVMQVQLLVDQIGQRARALCRV